MPPKKTTSRPNTAPGKEDDRLNSSQRSSSTSGVGPSATHSSTAHKNAAAAIDFGFSREDTEFLQQQKDWIARELRLTTAAAAAPATAPTKTPPSPVPLAAGTAAAAAAASSNKNSQQWQTEVLPKLKALVAKVLQVAATHYAQEYAAYLEEHKAELAAAAAGDATKNDTTTANTGNTANNKSGKSSSTIPRPGQASSTDVATQKLLLPTPPAGTPENFLEENEYLLAQLAQTEWAPFTLQRLLELLERPQEYHTTSAGKLRGGALQASLRRCLLVMCSFNPADTIPVA